MSQHMVIFENPDGHPGYNQFESVEDAVTFVERIRNEQGVQTIRIFELNEVKFELKPYYRVELQALNPGSPGRSAAQGAPPQAAAQPQPQAPPQAGQPQTAQPTRPAPAAAPTAPAPPSAPTEPAPSQGSPFAAPGGEKRTEPQAQPSAPAPVPPSDQPKQDDQPTRRGLFGR